MTRRLRGPGLAAGLLAAGAALAACAWLLGFAWFVDDSRRAHDLPARADGIIALTGGADRIATALALLRQERARLLLISGVGPQFDLAALLRTTGGDTTGLAARITLGRTATDTLGNAEEAAGWARANDVRTLIVVTAGYHMERALTEIGRALPEVRLYPNPVVPPALRRPTGVFQLRLLAAEYTKFLAARLGLTHLARVEAGG